MSVLGTIFRADGQPPGSRGAVEQILHVARALLAELKPYGWKTTFC